MHLRSVDFILLLGFGAAQECLPPLQVETASVSFTTSESFASWTIDPSRNRLFFNVNFSDERLLYFSAQIGGNMIRFGGGGGDLLTYSTPMPASTCGSLPVNEECLNATTFDSLLALSAASSSNLVVALNIQPIGGSSQPPSGPWNASNARVLLNYIRDHPGPMPRIIGFELGNECNGRGFTPSEQADAFKVLAGVVADVFSGSTLPGLIGPDADGANRPAMYNYSLANLCTYLAEFVGNASGLLSAVTYHEYIEVNATTVLNASYLDASFINAASVVAAVRSVNSTVPIWVGETGPHTGDSPPNSLVANCDNNGLCGRFGSILWYADALGAKAIAGVSLFARQDLVGGTYALINTSTPDGSLFGAFTPSPDYYWLWVWQRTVGTGVLRASLLPAVPPSIRAYAFCARGDAPSVAFVLINLGASEACLGAPAFVRPDLNVTQFTFTAGDGAGVQSWGAQLNGVALELSADGKLPPMPGKVVSAAPGFVLPPQSASIFVAPAALPACA